MESTTNVSILATIIVFDASSHAVTLDNSAEDHTLMPFDEEGVLAHKGTYRLQEDDYLIEIFKYSGCTCSLRA